LFVAINFYQINFIISSRNQLKNKDFIYRLYFRRFANIS